MNIALMGYGTVGTGVYDVLNSKRILFKSKFGTDINVKHILVRDTEKRRHHDRFDLFTTDFNTIREDNEIDIVIEVMGGITPTREYILESLKQKRHVVTANKELLAKHGKELMEAAQQNGVKLMYEGSVAGAIPIIDSIFSGLSANTISEITGIVNGTTNFILTSMKEKWMSFEEALKLAQDLGYAESCPDSDILGLDAARKVSILCMIAYGEIIGLDDFDIEGICNISIADIKYADRLGYEIRQLAICKREADGLFAVVAPFLVKKEHHLASVKDVFNAVVVKCDAADDIILIGKGAGKYPTASAVVGNVIQIATNRAGNFNGEPMKQSIKTAKDIKYSYFLRFKVKDREFCEVLAKSLPDNTVRFYEFVENNMILIIDKCGCQTIQEITEKIRITYDISDISKIRIYETKLSK